MQTNVTRGRGRPTKFGRHARSITLTLPDDVIERLSAADADADLGRAIVQMVDRTPSPSNKAAHRRLAEIARYGRRSVILVTPVRAFNRLRGVHLVPVSNGRALIALEHSQAVPHLELSLRDVLDDKSVKGRDRAVFEAVAEILREARLSHRLAVVERSIIVFEPKRRRARAES